MPNWIYQMNRVRVRREEKLILDDVTLGFQPGHWFWFEGNFAGYQHNRVDRFGVDSIRPHRTVHRKLTRD
ncbi:MAG TPA: hypothetical protein VHX38_39800 [Pseudonocardiaceae bacterium]|jgi:hypothetical protein|nr:hypothetical protein [Pseudonocardiaceae bacterium]